MQDATNFRATKIQKLSVRLDTSLISKEIIYTLLLFFTVMGIIGIICPATAASFDCKNAKTPIETLICRDSALSDLDERLGHVYQQRLAVLSAHGADMLQKSELSWLRFIAIVCPLKASANHRDSPNACLIGSYKLRLAELETVGQKLGPFIFNRIDIYAARPAPDSESGWTPGFFTSHVAYPQIDNSGSSQILAWNNSVAQSFKSALPNGDNNLESDFETSYKIGYANQLVISLQKTDSEYVHGNAHGIFNIAVINKVLFPILRDFNSEDLCGVDKNWVPRFQDTFWQALLKGGWSPADSQADTVEKEIKGEVIEPNQWLFTESGLQVSFSAYEGGCYACNPGSVTVPWADLKPLMSSAAIVP